MTLYCGIEQTIITTPGVQYTISYDISSWAGWSAAWTELRIGTTQGAYDLLQQSLTGNGSFSHNFTATTALTWVLFYSYDVSTGCSFDITNISVPGTTTIVIKEGGLAQLISGMADSWESLRQVLYTVGSVRDPYKTPILSDLEKEYGVFPDDGLTDQERREKLAAVKYARAGTGTIDDMQIALSRAFPDSGLTVYTNDPAADPRFVFGGNLVKDGDMEDFSVTPPWVVGNSALLTKSTVDPKNGLRCLRVRRNLVNNPYAEQDVLAIGKTYRFLGWARSDGSAIPSLRVGGQEIWQGTTGTDWQYFNETTTVTGSQLLRLTSVTSTGSEYTEWDEISISEVPVLIVNGQIFDLYTDWIGGAGEVAALCGQPTSNPTDPGPLAGDNNGIVKELLEYTLPTNSSQWPLLFFIGGQARYYSLLLDGDMERSDILAWTATTATLTKQTTDPYHGNRYLRVTSVSATGDARQTVLNVGADYRVIGWMRGDGTTTATVRQGGGLLASTLSTTWTKVDVEFTATGTTFELGKTAAGNYAEFDDFQVIQTSPAINQMECGEALAQCGEGDAYAGSFRGQIISIDTVELDEARQADFERLVLSVKPMRTWALAFVTYT